MAKRILVVDDDENILSLERTILEQKGFEVTTAGGGAEALEIIGQNDFDLVLLDVMMPEIDGFTVCRRIKEEPKTREIPVIFMTALAKTEHKVKGFKAGGVDYITKPLQFEEVLARVATHLQLTRRVAGLSLPEVELVDLRGEPAEPGEQGETRRFKLELKLIADIGLVGFPNAGKSTLLNSLLKEKVAIVSDKPQTTRHQVLGIKTEGDHQIIFVDTPGLHRGADKAINRYMNRAASSAIRDVDLVLFVVDRTAWTYEDGSSRSVAARSINP